MKAVPYWLVIFIFMCDLGVMFYATVEPKEHYVLLVLSVALCCALPHVPTTRN